MNSAKPQPLKLEHIVQQESTIYGLVTCSKRNAVGAIREYRDSAEMLRAEMAEKAIALIQNGADAEKVIQQLSHQLMNRLIHTPTKSLQQAASDGDIERPESLT